jgi:hypothetical protein
MDERIEAFLKDVVDLEGATRTRFAKVSALTSRSMKIWSAMRSLRGIKGTERLSLGASYAASESPKK